MKNQVRLSVRQTGAIQRKALIFTTLGLIPVTTLGVSLYSATANPSNNPTQNVQENTLSAADTSAPTGQTQSESAQSETDQNNQSVSVRVNGEPLEIPPSGSMDKTLTTEDGSVHVDVKSNSTPSDSSSSVNVQIQTNSSGEGGDDGETEIRTKTRIRIRER